MKSIVQRPTTWTYLFAISALATTWAYADRPNILLITADDMSCDSVGVFGCKVEDTTPNIDRLFAPSG